MRAAALQHGQSAPLGKSDSLQKPAEHHTDSFEPLSTTHTVNNVQIGGIFIGQATSMVTQQSSAVSSVSSAISSSKFDAKTGNPHHDWQSVAPEQAITHRGTNPDSGGHANDAMGSGTIATAAGLESHAKLRSVGAAARSESSTDNVLCLEPLGHQSASCSHPDTAAIQHQEQSARLRPVVVVPQASTLVGVVQQYSNEVSAKHKQPHTARPAPSLPKAGDHASALDTGRSHSASQRTARGAKLTKQLTHHQTQGTSASNAFAAQRFKTVRKAPLGMYSGDSLTWGQSVQQAPSACGPLAGPAMSEALELLDRHVISTSRAWQAQGDEGDDDAVDMFQSAAAGLAVSAVEGIVLDGQPAVVGRRSATALHRSVRARVDRAEQALADSLHGSGSAQQMRAITSDCSKATVNESSGPPSLHHSQPVTANSCLQQVQQPPTWLTLAESRAAQVPAMPAPLLRMLLAALQCHHQERCDACMRRGAALPSLQQSVLAHLETQCGTLARVPAAAARAAALIASVRAHAAECEDVLAFGQACNVLSANKAA